MDNVVGSFDVNVARAQFYVIIINWNPILDFDISNSNEILPFLDLMVKTIPFECISIFISIVPNFHLKFICRVIKFIVHFWT